MRVGVIGGLLLAFCVSAVPASAAVQASTAAEADPQAIAAGLRFARAVYSEESQLAIADRMVEVELGAMFRNNADFKTLEGEYPGFTDAVLRKFKVVLVRYTRSSLPDYHERIASLMASRLNAEEIADLTQFYLTPTGRKLLVE